MATEDGKKAKDKKGKGEASAVQLPPTLAAEAKTDNPKKKEEDKASAVGESPALPAMELKGPKTKKAKKASTASGPPRLPLSPCNFYGSSSEHDSADDESSSV